MRSNTSDASRSSGPDGDVTTIVDKADKGIKTLIEFES
jgi:hypothetical protein